MLSLLNGGCDASPRCVSDTSQHELVDVSHCKGLQHFSTLLLMHPENCPTVDLSENRVCTMQWRSKCVSHDGKANDPLVLCCACTSHTGGQQCCANQIVQRSSTPLFLVYLIVHTHFKVIWPVVKQEAGARTRFTITALNSQSSNISCL